MERKQMKYVAYMMSERRWYHVNEIILTPTPQVKVYGTIYPNGYLQFTPYTICEYIGLVDKNGKEIYEGHIDQHGRVVKWNQLHCCWGLFSKNGMQEEIMADVYDNKGKIMQCWQSLSIEVCGIVNTDDELLK